MAHWTAPPGAGLFIDCWIEFGASQSSIFQSAVALGKCAIRNRNLGDASGLWGHRPSCAYEAHNPEWWKTIPQEYLSCETDSNCVSVRAGGKQQEVSYWSVTPSAESGTESERDSAW